MVVSSSSEVSGDWLGQYGRASQNWSHAVGSLLIFSASGLSNLLLIILCCRFRDLDASGEEHQLVFKGRILHAIFL